MLFESQLLMNLHKATLNKNLYLTTSENFKRKTKRKEKGIFFKKNYVMARNLREKISYSGSINKFFSFPPTCSPLWGDNICFTQILNYFLKSLFPSHFSLIHKQNKITFLTYFPFPNLVLQTW